MSDDKGARRRRLLADARVCLIIEALVNGQPAGSIVEEALSGGVDIVQLRDKDADDGALRSAGRAFRTLCDRADALFIVNDRSDIALACDADGVHVGQHDAPVAEVRAAVGADRLIGLSTHSPAEIELASDGPCDYIAVGPVYETPTKPGSAPVGTDLVHYAATHATRPFFAIGGIDGENASTVVSAGAQRLAVVRAIRDASSPRSAAQGLRSELTR